MTSFTLNLMVDEDITFQGFSGFTSFNLFHNLVRSVDDDLAEELHSSKKIVPWSATPFIAEGRSKGVIYRKLNAPSTVNVTFTIMDKELSEVFKRAVLSPNLKLELGNIKVKLINIIINILRFSDIVSSVKSLPTKFAIRFITPTAFRRTIHDCCPTCPYYKTYLTSSEKEPINKPCSYIVRHESATIPLPLPSLMFRNLARIWSSFSDIIIDVWGAVKWAENAILVTGFPDGIKTHRIYDDPLMNRWIVGFTGKVRFAIKEEVYDENHAKTIAALLKMAEYTNTGIRRTAGMGMIRCSKPMALTKS